MWTTAVGAQSSSAPALFSSGSPNEAKESNSETLIDLGVETENISKYSFDKGLIFEAPSTNAVDLLSNADEGKITAQNNSDPESEDKKRVA